MLKFWFHFFQITRNYSFLDYILGGCQLMFTVSRSFTIFHNVLLGIFAMRQMCCFCQILNKPEKTVVYDGTAEAGLHRR